MSNDTSNIAGFAGIVLYVDRKHGNREITSLAFLLYIAQIAPKLRPTTHITTQVDERVQHLWRCSRWESLLGDLSPKLLVYDRCIQVDCQTNRILVSIGIFRRYY